MLKLPVFHWNMKVLHNCGGKRKATTALMCYRLEHDWILFSHAIPNECSFMIYLKVTDKQKWCEWNHFFHSRLQFNTRTKWEDCRTLHLEWTAAVHVGWESNLWRCAQPTLRSGFNSHSEQKKIRPRNFLVKVKLECDTLGEGLHGLAPFYFSLH